VDLLAQAVRLAGSGVLDVCDLKRSRRAKPLPVKSNQIDLRINLVHPLAHQRLALKAPASPSSAMGGSDHSYSSASEG